MKRWMAKAGVALACAAGVTTAAAQDCVGFTDVLASNTNVCNAVEWIKNRGVTQGCGTGLYCPVDFVTREQMALFMKRLGTSLTPELLGAQGSSLAGNPPVDQPTPIPNDDPGELAVVNCVTATSAATVYPRKAAIVGSFSGLADANVAAFRAFLLVSIDGAGYVNVIPGSSAAMRATLQPNAWGSVTMNEVMSLDAGKTYRFAIGFRRDQLTGVGGTLARYRCQLTASLYNRNGTTSPF